MRPLLCGPPAQKQKYFNRFDGCEPSSAHWLLDHNTEQLASTHCMFKGCNVEQVEERAYN